MPPLRSLPTSAIIGYFHVDRIALPGELQDPQAVGPYCWCIDKVRPLERPQLNVKGSMGLWMPQQLPPPQP
eukprot:703863-Prymnesium_polylepis.1